LRYITSLFLDWKLISLPLILSGVLKPNFWQAILIFLSTIPVSIAILIYLRNHQYARRWKEAGAEFPPQIPSQTLGGLDIVQSLRWEYHFGFIGDPYFGY
jgi:hypothetical protein